MKNNFKQFTLGTGMLFGVFLFVDRVLAQGGLETAAGRAGLPKISVGSAIGNVIGSGLALVSILFFILMIYGGIKYMMSRGNEESAKKAVNTIWGAVIGLIIVMAAYALTNFVFKGLGSGTPSETPAVSTPPPTITIKYCKAGSGPCEKVGPEVGGIDAEDCDNSNQLFDNQLDCASNATAAGQWCVSGGSCKVIGDEGIVLTACDTGTLFSTSAQCNVSI